MVTQLENNGFKVIDNIFSDEVLKILEPYAKLLPTDQSSYDIWPLTSTNNKTAPECFSSNVLGKDKFVIINSLFTNQQLPCFNKSWIKDCDIAVQKIPTGGYIPPHTDFCKFSLTVFLSNVKGGEFCWRDIDNCEHVVEPKINRGIIANSSSFKRGNLHQVREVKEGTRFTLQLFVFDKKGESAEKQGVIIEENIDE